MPKKQKKLLTKSKFHLAIKLPVLPKALVKNILGLFFVLIGTLFIFVVPVPSGTDNSSEEPIKMVDFKPTKKESSPVRIVIPKRDIDLDVKFSKIVKGYWEISETNASHGEGSANPGENGNIVIFAHARAGLFGNLKDISKDEYIYVFTKEKWFRYKVSEIKTVYPKQIQTVAPTDSEVLTLFTCSGFFDEKRLIVKAYPIK